MAKINVSFDTKTKELSATMDGSSLVDVRRIEFWVYTKDEAHVTIESVNSDDDEGVVEVTTILAEQLEHSIKPTIHSPVIAKRLGYV